MTKQDLVRQNEEIANRVSSVILLISTLAYPILILLGIFNIFVFDMSKLYSYCGIGTVCTVTPFILRKLGVNNTFLKYYTMTMTVIAIGLLSINYQIGIQLLLVFPLALSCIYINVRLTILVYILQSISIICTNYFKVISNPIYSSDPKHYYISTTIGYMIELPIFSMIFIWLTKRIKTLVHNLSNSEEQSLLYIDQLKGIMNSSINASETLSSSVKQLMQAVEQATLSNDDINQNAERSSTNCEKNLQYIEDASATVVNISQILETISANAQKLSEISKDTLNAAVENEIVVGQAISHMEEIEKSIMQNKNIITSLSEKSKAIEKIIELITNVTKQTNILAVNTAIEASRSNERGFSVIAEEIRKLAEKSASAAKDISEILGSIYEDTENAVSSIDQSYTAIESGIGMIKNVGLAFGNLKNLQDISNNEIQNITQSSIQTSKYGSVIAEIMTNTKLNTSKSLEDLKSIASNTSMQASVMQEILSSFNVIDNIADELLKTTKSVTI